MSYYTGYSLNVYRLLEDSQTIQPNLDIPAIVKENLEEEIERMNVFGDGDLESGLYVWTTWYNYEDDMRILSRRFPDLVLYLHGEGEQSEDMWDKYFVGGRMQECYAQIVYDDFDPKKLDSGGKKSAAAMAKYSYQR